MHNISHLTTCPDPGSLTLPTCESHSGDSYTYEVRCDAMRRVHLVAKSYPSPRRKVRDAFTPTPYSACLVPPFPLESVVGVYARAVGVGTCVISK